jgi:hypothetical protein
MSIPSAYTSGFYNPGQYAAPDQNWYNTPMGNQQREQNMTAAWYAYGRQLGVPDDQSAYGRWFNQQQPLYNAGFASASMENPYLRLDDYNATLGNYQDWSSRFNAMAPQLRGENPGNYGNVTRWLGW